MDLKFNDHCGHMTSMQLYNRTLINFVPEPVGSRNFASIIFLLPTKLIKLVQLCIIKYCKFLINAYHPNFESIFN